METDLNEDTHQQPANAASTRDVNGDAIELEEQSAQMREAIYSFLSAIYLQPISEETLQQICNELFLNDLVEVLPCNATTELQRYLLTLDTSNLSKEIVELRQEYMSLFTVPTGRYVAPFEDIYRGKTADGQPHRGPLLGVRAIAAKQPYREAGAEMDSVTKELPNHIGVELSFMRFLCDREAVALSAGLAIDHNSNDDYTFSQAEIYRAYQIRFLREHLNHWFSQLNEEIQKKSNHVLYKTIANITQEFLQQDLQILKHQLSNSIQ